MPDYIPPPDSASGTPAYIPPPDVNAPMSSSEALGVIQRGSGVVSPAPPLTKGQRAYRMVRPFVAPVVETVGLVGGGVAGAAGGAPAGGVGAVPGAVAGAGLGYGMARQAVKAADYNLGGYEPPAFNQQLLDAGKDIAEGAAMETAGPYINRGVAWTLGGLGDAGAMLLNALRGQSGQLAERRAAKILQEAASGSRVGNVGDFASAVEGAAPGQTGAQATAELNSPTFQALLKRAGQRDPGAIAQIENLQREASSRAIRSVAPIGNQTQGRQAAELLQEALNAETTPLREAAITGANATGNLKGLPVALQASGPLYNPSNAGNDLVEGAVGNFMDEVAKWTSANTGVIDATALDAIRKNAVNATIAKLRPGVDATTQRKMAARVLSDIKPIIDDAIEQAGGSGWKDYLARHSAGMQDISKTKLASEAMRLWETDPKSFVRLVEGNSPEVVEQILGPGQYDIAKALTQREAGIFSKEAQNIKTNESINRQATDGQQALADLLKKHMWKAKIPFLLNWKTSAANALLGKAEEGLGKNVLDQITEASIDPAKLAELLKRIPPSYRSQFLNALKSKNTAVGMYQLSPSVMSASSSGIEDDGRQ